MLDRVRDQVVEDVLDPIAIDHHAEMMVVGELRGREPARPETACGWNRLTASSTSSAAGTAVEVELDAALLDPGQVEQVVDHRQDAVGVLAGGQQQLDLLGRERARPALRAAGGSPSARWSAASSARG